MRFVHANDFFNAMAQARVDNSVNRTFRSILTPDLPFLGTLALPRLTPPPNGLPPSMNLFSSGIGYLASS